MEAGEWDTAREAFREIQGYQNADELWKESTYQWIHEAIENENWQLATDLLLELQEVDSTYRDVADLPKHYGIVGELGRRRAHVWLDGNIQQIGEFQAHAGAVNSVTFSPNAQVLVSGGADGDIRFWRAADGTLLHTLSDHTDSVNSVAFNPDGTLLASGSDDGTIKVWEVSGVQVNLMKTLTHGGAVHSVAFSPDGETIASGSTDNTVKLWQVPSGNLIRTLGWHDDDVYSVVFSSNSEMLISGSKDEQIAIWRVADGEIIRAIKDPGRYIFAVEFSPDGQEFTWASGGLWIGLNPIDNGHVIVHDLHRDVDDSRLVLRGHGQAGGIPIRNSVISLSFSPDGKTLASGGQDSAVILWRYADGQKIEELMPERNPSAIHCVAFSPSGHTLAAGNADGIVKMWRAEEQ
jgi:WD40 repeat protein